VGTLTSGSSATLILQGTVVTPGPRTNTARVLHSSAPDPVAANNVVSSTVTPQQSDLALSQVTNDAKPNVGDTISFTVTLTDKGPKTATNDTVTDTLPAGLSFVSAFPSQGTYNSGTGIWNVGTVTTGVPQTLLIYAMVISPSPPANKAMMTNADQFDPNKLNNAASTTIHPQQADLRLTSIVNKPRPNVGDTITFTLTLTSSGPSAATDVEVLDSLPAGLSFVSATPSVGSYSSGTGIWTIGDVAYGAVKKLVIQGLVSSPNTAVNTASVSHADQFDPKTLSNTASVTEQPLQANLALSELISNLTPSVNDTVLYTVTVTNAGPDTATGVTVSEFLPAGLTLVSATPSRGSYSSGTGIWNIGSLSPGTAVTLALHAHVDSPGIRVNTASITHADQFDPDAGNNSATVVISV
jgi:uncharacterized repeat protein (TIGR01451 family)